MEIKQLGANTFYVPGPTNIGLWRQNETDVYLIDAGNDKDAGRKLKKLLDAHGWTLKGILCTHSNADHIGGNAYLQRQYGCPVFSAGMEKAFISHPVLEPSLLYGGFPCKALRHKVLMAKPSDVVDVSNPGFPKEIGIIALPGHFLDMIGFRTPDDVLFVADCLSSEETLSKYKVGFIYDVKAYKETLEQLKTVKAKWFVPSHAAPAADLRSLIQCNLDVVQEIETTLLDILSDWTDFDEALRCLFDTFGLVMNIEQYVLVGSTIRSYLAYFADEGKAVYRFSKNRMEWKRHEGAR